MMRRVLGLAGGLLLLLPVAAHAQSSITFPLELSVDGRVYNDTITDSETVFFVVNQRTGNSYSLQVRGDFPLSWMQGAGNITVSTGAVPGLVHTQGTDPEIYSTSATNNQGDRISWTADGSALELFEITNSTGSSKAYYASVTDTTMFSPAFSTSGTFNTFYSFYNTTGSTCSGVLTLSDTGGSVVSTATVTVTSGATGATNTATLATPRNITGTAKFAHNCPPGAFLAEAAIANFTSTPGYIQIVKFAATRVP